MAQFSREFLLKTIQTWQSYYGSIPLTEEDAREIIANMIELFSLLDELDRKYCQNNASASNSTNEYPTKKEDFHE